MRSSFSPRGDDDEEEKIWFSDVLNVIDTNVPLILSQTVDISSISTTDPSDSLFSLPSLQI